MENNLAKAMFKAATEGNLEVVKYLFRPCLEVVNYDVADKLMLAAFKARHIEVAEYIRDTQENAYNEKLKADQEAAKIREEKYAKEKEEDILHFGRPRNPRYSAYAEGKPDFPLRGKPVSFLDMLQHDRSQLQNPFYMPSSFLIDSLELGFNTSIRPYTVYDNIIEHLNREINSMRVLGTMDIGKKKRKNVVNKIYGLTAAKELVIDIKKRDIQYI